MLAVDPDAVGVDERGNAAMKVDVMAIEICADPLVQRVTNDTTAVHERLNGDGPVIAQLDPVQVAVAQAREIKRGLSHRLAGHPGVRHRPAQTRILLDQRHLLVKVCGLCSAFFPGRSGADHDQIIGRCSHLSAHVLEHSFIRQRCCCGAARRSGTPLTERAHSGRLFLLLQKSKCQPGAPPRPGGSSESGPPMAHATPFHIAKYFL